MGKSIKDRFGEVEQIINEHIKKYSKSLSFTLSQIGNLEGIEISNINASDKGDCVHSLDKNCISPYFTDRDVYRFDIPVGNVRQVKDSEERAYFIRNGLGDTFTSFYIKIKPNNN
jgi:hypothetical protein